MAEAQPHKIPALLFVRPLHDDCDPRSLSIQIHFSALCKLQLLLRQALDRKLLATSILQSPNTTDQLPNLPSLTPRTLLLGILVFLMAFTMPSFISRLTRPFTTTTRLGLSSESSISAPEGSQKATIAAGCFWGVEHMYRKEFKGKGLYDARVGYIGGNTDSPSYRAVCSGRTGRMSPLLSTILKV